MFKKCLVGALTAVLMVEGALAAAPTAEAAKAKYPAPKYSYNFNKADKNVVAVTRKGDKDGTNTGTMPTKDSKQKVVLKKGKNGKSLVLDGKCGVELTNVKLKASKYSIAFWTKASTSMSVDYMPIFFANAKNGTGDNEKWISITKTNFLETAKCPVVWSHNAAKGQFPWTSDIVSDPPRNILSDQKWHHIVVTVGKGYGDAGAKTEYAEKGAPEYMKGDNVVIYVDGAMYGTGTPVADNIFDGKQRTFLGINCWDLMYRGSIDDVMLWDKALSEKQAQAVYKATK